MAKSKSTVKDVASPAAGPEVESSIFEPLGGHWTILALLVFVVAVILRFYDLDLKPLHHDEGVNGFFLKRLLEEGVYKYDPSNYHGPTLYYLTLVSSWIFGLNTIATRGVLGLFGVGVLALFIPFRRLLGNVAVLVAMALLAVSPGMVFQSRYFIHEILLVFFTMSLVVSAWKYRETGEGGWFLGAAASAAMMFATKETAFISWGVLVLAELSVIIYLRLRRVPVRAAGPRPPRGRSVLIWIGGIAVFLVINVILYSSFFTNAEGVRGAISTFAIWARTGERSHVHPWWTYLLWMAKIETSLLVFGALGAARALWRPDNRFAVFCAFWALGIVAAYSLVPYKTPWLMLNALPPLAILAGYLVDQVIRRWKVVPAVIIVSLAVGISFYQSVALNFYRYDDEAIPYVYAPTGREFVQMIARVEEISARIGTREDTAIAVLYADYWPMPWYLRHFTRVGYHGQLTGVTDPLVIGSEGQEPLLQERLGADYVKVGSWKQRNGLQPVLYIRRELAQVAGIRQ